MKLEHIRRFTVAVLVAGIATVPITGVTLAEEGDPVMLKADFENGASDWEPTDASAWRVEDTDKGKSYGQFKQSEYAPPHRSPHNISLLKDVSVGDFSLSVQAKSTKEDYNHRDMCLFFGYQDPAHFYYVHLGKKTDDHANQIFIVNGADRTKISFKTTPGTNWDDDWHLVRIARDTSEGAIAVYFDDGDEPIMVARDKTFLWGRIGVGSFDDIGLWDDLHLRGKARSKNP